MPILSSLFGGGSNETDSANSNDSFLDLDGSLSLSAETQSWDKSVDDDGSMDESWESSSIGTELDFGSIFSSMNDSLSQSDSDGLFG